MCVATLASDQPWVLVVIAYGFFARVLSGPSLRPLGQLVTGSLRQGSASPSDRSLVRPSDSPKEWVL